MAFFTALVLSLLTWTSVKVFPPTLRVFGAPAFFFFGFESVAPFFPETRTAFLLFPGFFRLLFGVFDPDLYTA